MRRAHHCDHPGRWTSLRHPHPAPSVAEGANRDGAGLAPSAIWPRVLLGIRLTATPTMAAARTSWVHPDVFRFLSARPSLSGGDEKLIQPKRDPQEVDGES
jgi:hypothetical protein